MSLENSGKPGPGSLSLNGSTDLFRRAQDLMPDGVTRVTIEKHPVPVYIAHAKGARLFDVDGNEYLDLNNNYTTLIHGHAFAPVINAINGQLQRGSCFANPTEHELQLAEILCKRVPSVERIRFVNTGTEAVMFAIKAARSLTGKYKIAKFEGAYHGAYDWAEISQNSEPSNWGAPFPHSVPVACGTPPSVLEEVFVLPSDDIDAMVDLIERNSSVLACVVIDLLSSRPGLVPFTDEFLRALREVTRRRGILVVDDEVLNFRQGYHGAAVRFGFEPDLVTLGKIIGGGLPIGAIAGPVNLMAAFSGSDGIPPLPQGGTFSANPLSMVAGIAAMEALAPAVFERLDALGDQVRSGLKKVIAGRQAPFSVVGMGSLFRIHPKAEPPGNYREAFQLPKEAAVMKRLVTAMLRLGIVMPASAASALSTPMTVSDIDRIIAAFDEALSDLKVSL